MNQNITLKQAKEFKKQTNSDTALRLARNAAMRGDIEDLAMDWEAFRRIDHTFSDMVSGEMPVTNQKSSGRCWGFAGLNLFRIYLGRKYNLKKFEFSQSYFMFWDKFEKSNYFLENIIATLNEPEMGGLSCILCQIPFRMGVNGTCSLISLINMEWSLNRKCRRLFRAVNPCG